MHIVLVKTSERQHCHTYRTFLETSPVAANPLLHMSLVKSTNKMKSTMIKIISNKNSSMFKLVGRPVDDPLSAEVADTFLQFAICGCSLETATKSMLDYVRDRSTGRTACATVESFGSIVTADSA